MISTVVDPPMKGNFEISVMAETQQARTEPADLEESQPGGIYRPHHQAVQWSQVGLRPGLYSIARTR
jgi:hypothetical protein